MHMQLRGERIKTINEIPFEMKYGLMYEQHLGCNHYSLSSERSPLMAGGIPLPEISLLSQSFQTPKEIHAILVDHS